MQVATWNVNSLKVRLPQVLEYLRNTACDILALQELKLENSNFPHNEFTALGYHSVFNGQKTYNGVAIISKYPICDTVYDIPDYSDRQKRVISATINISQDGISNVSNPRIICAYVVNGESVGSEKYRYKLNWLNAFTAYVENTLQEHTQLIVLGDFNIAPHDIDVYDPSAWHEQVLCSASEREAWNRLLALGLHDSFRLCNAEAGQYSWWDYRNFAFRRKMGLRIDHILVSDALKTNVLKCAIDRDLRGHERPSDHAPVILSI